jgi:hypothetical protein
MGTAQRRRWLLTALVAAGAASLSGSSSVAPERKLELPREGRSPLESGLERNRDPRFRDAAAAEVRRRIDAIREEKARLGTRHWAGEYYSGDGLGVNQYLYLAPKAGFAFEWHGCLGLYDRNWGTVAQHGDTLVLEPAFPNDRKGFRGVPDRFRWIQWGDKTFLLPGDSVAALCNGLNGVGSPWGWLEQGDVDLPDPPLNRLPEEVRRCLLPRPLEATVTATRVGPLEHGIGGWDYREVVAEIDVGANHGVFEEMGVYLEGYVLTGTVETVGPEASSARFVVDEHDASNAPRPGQRVTTRAPW